MALARLDQAQGLPIRNTQYSYTGNFFFEGLCLVLRQDYEQKKGQDKNLAFW